MWTKLALLGALALCVSAHLQTPLTFGAGFNTRAKVSHKESSFTGYGAPVLGDVFERFAKSDVDASALHAFNARPELDINTLSEETFTTLTHPAYPKHGVRVKKSRFCDGTVDAYTGYVDVEARHIFFYFFKSRSDWTKDDVIFWTNGGPGCSSSIGLFMELGPCRITDPEKGPEHFKYGWNEHANIFFVDQPIGVGYSYADHGETVSTTEEAAIDIAFLAAVFFEHFSELKGRAFHMAGESYGGRYLPLFASAVHDLNPRLVKAGFAPVNLTSVMIGNGMTDIYTMKPSYFDMACTPASVDPIVDISTCVRMKQAAPRCEKMMKTSCVDTFDGMGCQAAVTFCAVELQLPFWTTGMNPYDISKECEGTLAETLCYPATKRISEWLSLNTTHKLLGVDPPVAKTFSSCTNSVNSAFMNALDMFHPTHLWVAGLLERGVRALIYVGEYDWICNWVGNSRWVKTMEWSGSEGYKSTEEGVWEMDGEVKGRKRTWGGLTFATIRGAGHMVPYDKPEESLEMVRRWLKNEAF